MSTIFLTGFPGFLGSELVKRLLKRYPDDVSVTCLIQEKFRNLALERISEIDAANPGWGQRIELVAGDITLPDLGLTQEQTETLQRETLEIYHLAAIYSLAVPRALAMRVNVDGTRYMLRFGEKCEALRRFQYVSTCYVSGRYPGTFRETDLKMGQTFNNYYEETKYWAEVEVQQAIARGLPATIYRPAIVAGDSQTGATQKYDGPYYVFQWILRQPYNAFLPVIGDPAQFEANVVPRDYVIDALDYLSGREESEGQVYQLSDPNPLSVDEMIDVIAEVTEHRIWRVPLPLLVAKGSLQYVPGVYDLMRIEPEAIDYFIMPTHFTCENTLRDLAGSGITCPPFREYAPRLIEFMRAHPEYSSQAMV